MPLVDPADLLPDAGRVRDALDAAGWSPEALDALLGATARTHLDRGETAPVLRRTAGGSPLEVLARLLVVGAAVDPEDARRAGLPDSWLEPAGSGVVARLRLQALRHDGVALAVPHDPGTRGAAAPAEQVLGVGAASLTLAAAVPRDLVGRALDLGAGSGVQSLLLADHADAVTATDLNPRAVAYARLAAALHGTELDVRQGAFAEPVAGERFDLVVSNPPFVVGPPTRWTYRDGGLEGDAASERVVRALPELLVEGGQAVVLANWLHRRGEDGDARVTAWLEGLDGWVVQRELAAPEDYVTAWLRDGDEPFDDGRYDAWLDWLEAEGVEAVAFGVVCARRPLPGRGCAVVVDEVVHPVAPTWGDEVAARWRRLDALAGDVLASRWRLRDDVRLHQVARATDQGWVVGSQLLRQEQGLRRSGGADEHVAALLAACDGTRSLGDLVGVLALAVGQEADEVADAVEPVVRHLVAQGFLEPA